MIQFLRSLLVFKKLANKKILSCQSNFWKERSDKKSLHPITTYTGTLQNSAKIPKNKRTCPPTPPGVETFTPLIEKVNSELLEKTKNFLSTEKDKNPKNTSKDCENSQTKATNNINSMATREYVTRNKAKGPYTHTSLPQTQKRQKKTPPPKSNNNNNRIRSRQVT